MTAQLYLQPFQKGKLNCEKAEKHLFSLQNIQQVEFFMFMGIKMATDGVLRGIGNMRPFLIANMVNLAIRLSVALIFAPRFGIAFVWLAVPAGWLANFIISYAALKKSWPKDTLN